MKLNGEQFIIACVALILSAALLYAQKLPLEVFLAIFFTIVGYYFGGMRGVYNAHKKGGKT